MQFITTDNRIAVENFQIGYFYTITFNNHSYIITTCTGKGDNFVSFLCSEPELVFDLTMQTADSISTIELYGGGTGTTDYNNLSNKPTINNVVLAGNKTTSDLHINDVPTVTSADDNKILLATYSAGVGSYSWETYSPISSYTDLTDKPTINSVTLTGNKTSSDLGIQSEIDSENPLLSDNVSDTDQTHKFATATQLSQIATNQTNILTLQNEIYYNKTYAIDNIDSLSTISATNAKKWIAVILPENAVVSYIKQAVVGNSTDYVKLEKWEENNGVFTLSSTVTASSITQESGKYVLNFAGFTTAKRTLITFSDTSSNGWLQYKNISGYNCQKFDANLTSVTEADISNTGTVKLYVDYEYTTQGKKGVYIVDINGSGDFTSVAEAVDMLPSNTTILVKPGVYNGNIRSFYKRLNIIGTDREKCIIRSTDGRYANPAIECCCGYMSNLTIKSEYVNGESQEITTTESGAYAIHCETQGSNGSLAVGDSLTIENCNIISDFFPAIGVGSFKNWSLNLLNCNIISNQPVGRATYTDTGGLGALYFHDMNGETGTAILNVKDTIIQSTILANTMTLYDLNKTGADIQCRFINNTLYSAVNGFTDSVYFRGITTAFSNNFHLQPISHGNTGSVLNS